MFIVNNKIHSIKRCQLSSVIITVRGCCLLGGCIYSLNSIILVIPMVVFHVCRIDENCVCIYII